MARPRKPGDVHRLQVTLCLWEGEDDDLIAYLVHGDIQPGQRAQAVITAMRGGLETAVSPAAADDDELTDGLLDMVF